MTRRLGNRAVLQEHADKGLGCELAPFRACCGGHGPAEFHHVLRGHGNRIDAAWNLVSVCPQSHRWCEQDTEGGMVLCWWAIHQRGELDLQAISDFWRRCAWQRIRDVVAREDDLQRIGRKLLEIYP